MPIDTIAIIGAGALGATYGSLLYAMDQTCVCFIASGERYQRLTQHGVTVNDSNYRIAVIRPEEATPVDLLIVAVKYHQLDQAIREIEHAVGPHTTIISVMNGIDSEERIAASYGMDKVMYGLTLGIDAVREHSNVHYSNLGRVLFGEQQNQTISKRVKRIKGLFNRAGITHTVPHDMLRALWFKYMINVGVNQVSAIMGLNYGAIRASVEAKELMDAAMREVISIARALHINLSEHDLAEWYSVLDTLGASNKTSMLQDVEAGRKTEVDMLAGTVIRLGQQYGIPTPVNQRLYDTLKRIEASSFLNC
jgi:2-dehydropantoate 2-reductase